jgi:hypothetical protein
MGRWGGGRGGVTCAVVVRIQKTGIRRVSEKKIPDIERLQ